MHAETHLLPRCSKSKSDYHASTRSEKQLQTFRLMPVSGGEDPGQTFNFLGTNKKAVFIRCSYLFPDTSLAQSHDAPKLFSADTEHFSWGS